MPVTIYHRTATRSLRNIWLCEELVDSGVMKSSDWSVVDVPDPMPAEYLKLTQGLKRIPCADVDGDVIFESGAILEYTLAKYGKGSLEGTPAERPYYLQWMHFAETLTQGARTPTIMGVLPATKDWKIEDARAETTGRIRNGFAAVEEVLQNQDYMLKSGFSAVDIQTWWGMNAYFNMFKLLSAQDFPKCAAYLARLSDRPAYKRMWEYRKPDSNRKAIGKL